MTPGAIACDVYQTPEGDRYVKVSVGSWTRPEHGAISQFAVLPSLQENIDMAGLVAAACAEKLEEAGPEPFTPGDVERAAKRAMARTLQQLNQ